MSEDVQLDLSRPEALAVVVSLVPNWAELADGLDLRTARGEQVYRDRIQAALDEAVANRAAQAQALSSLPLPARTPRPTR